MIKLHAKPEGEWTTTVFGSVDDAKARGADYVAEGVICSIETPEGLLTPKFDQKGDHVGWDLESLACVRCGSPLLAVVGSVGFIHTCDCVVQPV